MGEREHDIPPGLENWFKARGWTPRRHQLEMLDHAQNGRSALLIAPTGAGKTLAGFLPTLVEAARSPSTFRTSGLHTLYLSPLKALAVDVARNLLRPVDEMALPIRIETRTGDTPTSRRQRQRRDPPQILLTTPEQLALLLASRDAQPLFSSLRRVVLDELHALAPSKRGDLLALGLARIARLAPGVQMTGLSATVADPDHLRRYLSPFRPAYSGYESNLTETIAALVTAESGAAPDLRIHASSARIPWSGHSARHAHADIYDLISRHKTTLVFVNTRSQAEMLFQNLWAINEASLPIALHHGSLDVSQRRRVEEAMAKGELRAVVCTSSLDLGIDWGDVDLVINVGAPKGASRMVQRIGRANHRLDEPSRAILVPANRFEVMECVAAVGAIREGVQDAATARSGGLDVLAQHVMGTACSGPFDAADLFEEVRSAPPYADVSRETFDDVVQFVATGGYALKSYDRFARIRQDRDGRWRLSHPSLAQQWRMNVGTIVEEAHLKVRLTGAPRQPRHGYTGSLGRGGRVLGEVEEYFVEGLLPGDTFIFGGEILRYEAIVENEVHVSRSTARDPKVPAYAGGKFPLSTFLAERVRALLSDEKQWSLLPSAVQEWLKIQKERSTIPARNDLLIETFPHHGRYHLVAYPFEGRLAHQTLGMLLTRRMERHGLKPMGFVANDYALSIWGIADLGHEVAMGRLSLSALFDQDMLGDDLEAWLDESQMMKRTFRTCAIIAGLIERRLPGREKTGRQMTISSDLIHDVLRRHEPNHVLLRAARAEAATGLLDIARLGAMLGRIQNRIRHSPLDRISPLAVPILLEIGREAIQGAASEEILRQSEAELLADAGLLA